MTAPHSETAVSRLQSFSRKPRAVRRLAVLADVDLALAVLNILAAAGYGVSGLPADSAARRAALLASDGDAIMLNDYSAFHATVPTTLRNAISARWGTAEHDPLYRPGRVDCGRLVVPVACFGAVAVIAATTDDPSAPPRHHALARIAWIIDIWRADVLIAQRPLGFAAAIPVLIPVAADAPDIVALVAALDYDGTVPSCWRVT